MIRFDFFFFMDFGPGISEHISISGVASIHVAEAYEETRRMLSV